MTRRIRRKVTEDQVAAPRVRYAPVTKHQLEIVEEANNPVGPAIEIGMTKEQVQAVLDQWWGRAGSNAPKI
jgi:hypothetical protein